MTKKLKKNKKINKYPYATMSVSKCNLKYLSQYTAYPTHAKVTNCLICGKPLRSGFCYATKVNETTCAKLWGSECFDCKAVFLDYDYKISWIRNNSYANKHFKFDEKYRHYKLHNVEISTSNSYDSTVESTNTDELNNTFLNEDLFTPIKINYGNEINVGDNESNNKSPQDYFENIPPLTATTYVFVYDGNIKCHREHHMCEVRVIVKEFGNRQFFAEYCSECNQFLIKLSDYERYLDRYKFIPFNIHLYDGFKKRKYLEWAEKSPLRLNGYTVSQEANLSEKQRHEILTFLIDQGIMEKRRVLNYIERFIAINGQKQQNWVAKSKWEGDRDFILDYTVRPVPLIIADVIVHRHLAKKYNNRDD